MNTSLPNPDHDGLVAAVDLFQADRPEARPTQANRIAGDSGGLGGIVSDPAPDPFDLARLRLSQDFAANLGVRKMLMTVPVRKPAKEWWVQTHPDATYRIETAVLELKEDREIYIVASELWSELATETTFSPRALITSITRQNVIFLWPVRLPGSEGKSNPWNDSALEAALRAAGRWVRVEANMCLGAYEVRETMADIPAPQWPDVSFQELVRVAFKGKMIDSADHPVLRKLRGEI